jgi:azurin
MAMHRLCCKLILFINRTAIEINGHRLQLDNETKLSTMENTMKIIQTSTVLLALLGFAGLGYAQDCELSIDGNDALQFSESELTVSKDCGEVKLTLTHVGALPKSAMGHNWVLTDTSAAQAVVSDGISAGLDNDYIKPGDDRVLAHTAIIGGGESTTITFSVADLEAGGDYTFFCSFPGHFAIMKGKFIVT